MSANYIGKLPAINLSEGDRVIAAPAEYAETIARQEFGGDCKRTPLGYLHFVRRTKMWRLGKWQDVPLSDQFIGFTSADAARQEATSERYNSKTSVEQDITVCHSGGWWYAYRRSDEVCLAKERSRDLALDSAKIWYWEL